jgi:glutamine synthetase
MTGSEAILKKIYQEKKSLLKLVLNWFIAENNFIPKVGIELEFYLFEGINTPVKSTVLDQYILDLKKILFNETLIYAVERESGASQIEIKTLPTIDLSTLCDVIENVRNASKLLANKKNLNAIFESQPLIDDCGSAMQFNISLCKNHKNLFKDKNYLLFAIAGILEFIDQMMIFCADKSDDYLRFDNKINLELFKKGKFTAPINICFGENNRTCLIRIPTARNDDETRLEFRAGAAGCDPFLVISSVLIAINYGIKNRLNPCKYKIFGNAFDEMYNLREFPKNLDFAENIFFSDGSLICKTFDQFLEL